MLDLLRASATLLGCSLASVDAVSAATSIQAMRHDAVEDSFDVAVTACVHGFYALTGLILSRPGADISKFMFQVGREWYREAERGGYSPNHIIDMRVNVSHNRSKDIFLELPQDGASLCPINKKRCIHEGSDGYWAHGKMQIGTDIPAARWHLDMDEVCFIGFADAHGPGEQLTQISEMWDYGPKLGMRVSFKMNVPGNYQLTLRPFSDEWLIAELSPGEGYSHARFRYLPINRGPYHLVAHIRSADDSAVVEPAVRMTSCTCFNALEALFLMSQQT
jgi:hypothetical protein